MKANKQQRAIRPLPVWEVPFMRRKYAASICSIILCRKKDWIDERVQNHERIHLEQQKEMLFVFFFIGYAIEWVYRCIRHRSIYQGYRHMSYEKEAYAHDADLSYLYTRRHYAQFR